MKSMEELLGQSTFTDEELAKVLRSLDNIIENLSGYGARYQIIVDDLILKRYNFLTMARHRVWIGIW